MRGAYADAVRAEGIKARSLASTGWYFAAMVVCGVGLSTAVCAFANYGIGGGQHPTRLALSGVRLAQAPAAVWGVQAVGNEYRSGLIQVTVVAVPRRTVLLAAKGTVIGILTLAAGTVTTFGCLLAAHIELPHSGPRNPDATAGPTLRAAATSALTLSLISLLALGTALAARGSAAATGVVVSLLYLFPLATQFTGDPTWHRRLDHIGPTAGLPALAVWTAAALLIGGVTFHQDAAKIASTQ